MIITLIPPVCHRWGWPSFNQALRWHSVVHCVWVRKVTLMQTTHEHLILGLGLYDYYTYRFMNKFSSSSSQMQLQTPINASHLGAESRLNNAPQRSPPDSARLFESWPSLKQWPSCLWSACSVASDNMSERQSSQIKAEPVTSRQIWRARLAITEDAYKQPNTTAH